MTGPGAGRVRPACASGRQAGRQARPTAVLPGRCPRALPVQGAGLTVSRFGLFTVPTLNHSLINMRSMLGIFTAFAAWHVDNSDFLQMHRVWVMFSQLRALL
jgi:hypothetical protein